MSFGGRILSRMKTIVLIEERTKLFEEALRSIKAKVETAVADHERRLTRLDTIVRPDGAMLRITAGQCGVQEVTTMKISAEGDIKLSSRLMDPREANSGSGLAGSSAT
jgi:hypothetical protein